MWVFHFFSCIWLLQSVLWFGHCMDSLLFNFHHKLCEFYLNSPAKILAGIIFLEYYDYFYKDSNLSDLCLQRMQKRLPVLLSRS